MATLSEVFWTAFHGYHACAIRGSEGSKGVLELVERRALHWMPWIEVKPGPNLIPCFHHVEETRNWDKDIEEEKNKILAEGTKWSHAFQPLWIHSRREEGKRYIHGGNSTEITRPSGSCL